MKRKNRSDAHSKLSSSHMYVCFFHCVNLGTDLSPRQADISIHTVHLAKKQDEGHSAVCVVSIFLLMVNLVSIGPRHVLPRYLVKHYSRCAHEGF